MHLDLLQSVSLAGNLAKPNEDRAGAGTRHAWVIDGATDLGEPGLMGSRSGAAWLASAADRAFAGADVTGLAAAVRGVYAAVASAYEAERRRDPLGGWERPSAAFLAVALDEDGLRIAWAGDCTGWLLRGEAMVRLGAPQNAAEAESARQAMTADPTLVVQRGEATVALLRRSRERPERRVLSIDAARHVDVHHAAEACTPGDELVLMSDGFAALVDDYGMAPDTFVATLRQGGLAPLAEELRAIERADSGGARFPRFKASDDATALWLRVAAA